MTVPHISVKVHKVVDHNFVNFVFSINFAIVIMMKVMEKAFVYGMSVGGNNFTDRIEETKRIRLDFEV